MKIGTIGLAVALAFGAVTARADTVTGVEYAPVGNIVALAVYDDVSRSTVHILNGTDHAPVAQVDLPHKIVDLAFSPDGKFLATVRSTVNDQFVIEIWAAANWRIYRTLTTYDVSPFTTQKVAFIGKKKRLAIARFNKKSQIWTFKKASSKPSQFEPWISAFAATTNGRYLAYSSGDRTRIYDVKRKRETKAVGKKSGNVAAFGRNNKLLAVALKGKVDVYKARKGKHLKRIVGIVGTPDVISFQPGGELLAYTTYGSPVEVANARTGVKFLRESPPGIDYFTDAALSPDGKRVAASTIAGNVHVWDVASGALIETLSY